MEKFNMTKDEFFKFKEEAYKLKVAQPENKEKAINLLNITNNRLEEIEINTETTLNTVAVEQHGAWKEFLTKEEYNQVVNAVKG